QFAAKKEEFESAVELSITIVTTEEIQSLNEAYRQKNEPTDVLSFPIDNPFIKEEERAFPGPIHVGDIVICFDKVEEQALRFNHSMERELCFLAVHGFFHLLGYTHENKAEEAEMFQKQEEVL